MKVLTCPWCNADIYEVLRDVKIGDKISASDFKGINGYKSPTPFDPMICPNCSGDIKFMRTEWIHTK